MNEFALLEQESSPVLTIGRIETVISTGKVRLHVFPLSSQLNNIARLMDAAELRQRVVSHNLANVNTPGYRRLDVAFEEALAQSLKSGTENQAQPLTPEVFEEQGLPQRADGNNVDIDREVSQLNRNAMLFQTYSQILGSQFDMLRRATRHA